MRIIDAHAHLPDIEGYLESLIKIMDECGIEKACISGLGKLFCCVEDDGIKDAVDKYPDRLIGSVFIRPGVDGPQKIEDYFNHGFKMVKVSVPTKPYDDISFFPLWKKADELKMPILFHTGIVTLPKMLPEERISSWHMHPMRLEPISNAFPDLNIIIAHLGIHWNDDAAELIRMKSNVYADLTGEPDGWRVRADAIGIKRWLWWPGAFKKIVFGTDVFPSKISLILEQDLKRLDKYKVSKETRESIFSGNLLKMIGEK